MTAEPKKNLAASVRYRLLTLSQQRKEPFDLVLVRFGIERLLYRLSQSTHARKFLLKGAMLFAVWSDVTHRPTRDVDLLGFGDNDTDELTRLFAELCDLPVEPDGLVFMTGSVRASPIREAAAYPGIRVTLEARLDRARMPLQVDIGFGDVVTPEPEHVNFPALLEFAAPQLRAYPIYTVVAEKLEATVRLGEANTRMKDFFDLWFLSRNYSFEGELLRVAISRTFTRRETALPRTLPAPLTPEFAERKSDAWTAFVRRNGLGKIEMAAALKAITAFAWPAIAPRSTDAPFAMRWNPSQGWRERGQQREV